MDRRRFEVNALTAVPVGPSGGRRRVRVTEVVVDPVAELGEVCVYLEFAPPGRSPASALTTVEEIDDHMVVLALTDDVGTDYSETGGLLGGGGGCPHVHPGTAIAGWPAGHPRRRAARRRSPGVVCRAGVTRNGRPGREPELV